MIAPTLLPKPGGKRDDEEHGDSSETQYDDYLEDLYNSPSSTTSGSDIANRNQEIEDLEAGYNAPDAEESGSSRLAKANELKDNEEEAGSENDAKLGRGYTGKGADAKNDPEAAKSRAKTRRRVGIAGGAVGGGILGGVFVFLALLPLKVEAMIKNLESNFGASVIQSMTQESDNMFANFMRDEVMPNLGKGRCHSTIDAACVSVAPGSSPVKKLWRAWAQGKLEQKMATGFGNGTKSIEIGAKGSQYYMKIGGQPYADPATMNSELHKVEAGKLSLFDVGGNPKAGVVKVSRNDIRKAIRDSLKEGTWWDKSYTRFKIGRLLESKYGIKRCIMACDIRDKFADTIADKKLAGKAWLIARVVTPYSQGKGLILQCIIAGTCTTEPDEMNSDPNDPEKVSKFQRDLQSQLQAFAAKYGADKLKDLVEKANKISKDGVALYVAKAMLGAGLDKAGASDATKAIASGALEKATSIAGWIQLAASIVNMVTHVGKDLKVLSYSVGAAAAVATYMTYATPAAEVQSGHADLNEYSSLARTLDNGGIDASSTPEYAKVNNVPVVPDNSTTALLDAVLPSSVASAASANPTGVPYVKGNAYLCKNGKPVPQGLAVCAEEVLNGGVALATTISNAVNSIPGWGALATIATFINYVGNLVGDFIGGIVSAIPGIDKLTGAIGDLMAPLFKMLTAILPNIFEDAYSDGKTAKSDNSQATLLSMITGVKAYAADSPSGDVIPSGARLYDMMAAGADVSFNKSCQVQLGCMAGTAQQVADARNAQIAQQKQDFESMPLFARMFSTDTPYSMVSRMALTMPTSMLTATNDSIASVTSNPLGKLLDGFSALFTGNHAFAASAPSEDEFGVNQMVMPKVSSDPDAFFQKNCVNGPLATYNADNDTLDVSDWAEAQKTDPDTGETTPAATNECLLIKATEESAGVKMDHTLAPAGSTNPDSPDNSAMIDGQTDYAWLNQPTEQPRTPAAQHIAHAFLNTVTNYTAVLPPYKRYINLGRIPTTNAFAPGLL